MEEKEILKRYYRGETTVEEENQLKAAFRKGLLPNEPVLAFQQQTHKLPEGLEERIRIGIRKRRNPQLRYARILLGSIAAMLLLMLTIRSLLPTPPPLQLSDRLKKERFEDALRVIGNVLEEQHPPVQRILYEDSKLIIAVE